VITKVPRRLALVLALVVVGQGVVAHVKAAHRPPRPLTSRSFFDFSTGANPNSEQTIATVAYGTAIEMIMDKCCHGTQQQVSLNSETLASAGYNAVTLYVGAGDYSNAGTSGQLRISRDGQVYQTLRLRPGSSPQRVTVPFGPHKIIRFLGVQTSFGHDDDAPLGTDQFDIVLGNPMAVDLTAPANGAALPALPRLSLAHPSVAAGAHQTVTVTVEAGVYVTIVVAYPGVPPQVIGQERVGPAGVVIAPFAVSPTVHGNATVIVIVGDQVVRAGFVVT